MTPTADTDAPVSLLNAATAANSTPTSSSTPITTQVMGEARSAELKVNTAAEAAAELPLNTPKPMDSRFTAK